VSALPTAPSPDSDLLSSEVLAKYFAAREHEVYFRSLKSVDWVNNQIMSENS
jgi:hypothetical protein